MTFTLVRPNGREETLLSVPKYNPNWQITYELARPLKIPARSTIKAVARYDNSANNRYNPAPDREVVWGAQGVNEIFIPFLEVSVDKNELRFEGIDQRQVEKSPPPSIASTKAGSPFPPYLPCLPYLPL